MTVNVADDVARRLEAAAAARGLSVDEFATGVLSDNVPEVASTPGRRHLAFVGIGVPPRTRRWCSSKSLPSRSTRGFASSSLSRP